MARLLGGMPALAPFRKCLRVALIPLLCTATACYSWVRTGANPRRVIEGDRPAKIRVTRIDGTHLVILNPSVRDDSIVKTAPSCGMDATTGVRVCSRDVSESRAVLALGEVNGLEIQRYSRQKTSLLVLGTPIVASVTYVVLFCIILPGDCN